MQINTVETANGSLAGVVKISRQFLRSVRVDTDFGRPDALAGYVCQGTSRSLLENMARQILETNQRAFTWTGPYGGGKSSLALMLCSLVSDNRELRLRAKHILDLPADSVVYRAFDAETNGWCVVPVVGKRTSIVNELYSALTHAEGNVPKRGKRPDVIKELVAMAESKSRGVLVVIDELGKFLEASAKDGDDVHFFQELAEAASRCNGKLVVVGILHQPFEAYASRLGRESREDWAKIQGRYIDIPLVSATDEVIELVGRAIERDFSVDQLIERDKIQVVADSIRARRPGTPAGLSVGLANCWPLHPITAALLGPISRRRFGQNERSTFGFLASREPLGFIEFLEGAAVRANSVYDPARYWDYLKANLEPAIMASPDGHRWAAACDAVERAETKGEHVHVCLTKVVALIEMFRNGSGLVPEERVLANALPGVPSELVHKALANLLSWKILIERKHLGAYGIYAGSDFDIDGAINHSRYELGTYSLTLVSSLSDMHPILAKRLYQETGTMRWFSRKIIELSKLEAAFKDYRADKGSVGTFFLCLPEAGVTAQATHELVSRLSSLAGTTPILVGIPKNADRIADLALELGAVERVVLTRPELEGDSVAKRELTERKASVAASLEEELADAFGFAVWYYQGMQQSKEAFTSLTMLASKVAQDIYYKAPRVLSELINREVLSSNSIRARKDLMYKMITCGSEPNLGYSGYSADAGLYYSVLQGAGLHLERKDGWGFGSPAECVKGLSISPLWWDTEKLVSSLKKFTLANIYSLWSNPPYGVRSGLMPILGLSFFLSNRSSLAMYIDGVFTPDISESSIDEWLLEPARIKFQLVEFSQDKAELVAAIAGAVSVSNPSGAGLEPLDAARGLVSMVFNLPSWTKRTSTVSAVAQDVRAMLLKASDPHKVLFADLPTLLCAEDPVRLVESLKLVIEELSTAYPKMLDTVHEKLLIALDHQGRSLAALRARAAGVKGISGNFLVDAFATRLESYDGSILSIEKLVSLATNKPPAQWVDRDIDAALSQIGSWAVDLRREEVMAPLHGRPASRRVIGVVFGAKHGKDASGSVDISEEDVPAVDALIKRVLAAVRTESRDVVLAALAEAGALLMTNHSKEAD